MVATRLGRGVEKAQRAPLGPRATQAQQGPRGRTAEREGGQLTTVVLPMTCPHGSGGQAPRRAPFRNGVVPPLVLGPAPPKGALRGADGALTREASDCVSTR